jgi:hypothetical protein
VRLTDTLWLILHLTAGRQYTGLTFKAVALQKQSQFLQDSLFSEFLPGQTRLPENSVSTSNALLTLNTDTAFKRPLEIFMKAAPLILITYLLVSCTTNSEPVGDWIDVPLSDHTWSAANREFLSGTYEVPVEAFSALEYKIGMQEGDSIVYSLTTDTTTPELLGIEFHGHTERLGDAPGTVMFYVVHREGEEKGSLTAPFSGIHGWYLDNQSEEDIVVTLDIAGFYEVLE